MRPEYPARMNKHQAAAQHPRFACPALLMDSDRMTLPHRLACLVTLLLLLPGNDPMAAPSTARLPDWVCDPDRQRQFSDGFEAESERPYQEPSHGHGGAYPGRYQRQVQLTGRTHHYYLFVPEHDPAAAPLPVMLALHGAAGPQQAAHAARGIRDAWVESAQRGGFAVVAPVASGPNGGWVPTIDYPALDAMLDDLGAHYNVDFSRLHAWGFSAGGHVLHDLALHRRGHAPDIDRFASYAVSAGVLQAVACNPQIPTQPPDCTTLLTQAPRRIPVSLSVGDSDSLLPIVQNNRDLFIHAGWLPGHTLEYTVFAGGHLIQPRDFNARWQFMCPFQRRP